MAFKGNGRLSRRRLLGGAAACGSLLKSVESPAGAQSPQPGGVNRNSAPSKLRITDMRACRIASGLDYPIIRIDTNQGVSGFGEVRDAGVEGIALVLKPHLVGKNPLNIEPLLDSIRKFSNHLHLGGGYSAVDIALHDIAGKVYGVPCWRLLGSRYRDRVRVYCHLPSTADPKAFAEGVRLRKQMGFTFFKTSWSANLVAKVPGAVNANGAATEKGLKLMCEILDMIRDAIGWEAELALDHLGYRLRVNDCIRYVKALEPYQLTFAEDVLPALPGELGHGGNISRDWRRYKEIKEATTTPLAAGEDLFGLEEGFVDFIDNRAIDIVHIEPLTAGGIRETKRIADYAAMKSIPTAVHCCVSPLGTIADVHAIATIRDFLALERNSIFLDLPWWQDLVTGIPKPIIQNGYIPVPDKPGLGVELNEEVVRQHLRVPGYFEPTPQFDKYILDDYRPGGPVK
ncbi:MAG: mandelate racemase/muconate lactonizing enzyme family protein [Bryobacterales bacterium]|nr:mandelate racemase/muconate lactonizing enzyme family protein [Bryobacterales bacterium]